ncbi:MAG TPA: hypothetical protein VMW64_01025 [Dehalococcoidia bacterium]|nr:hypothetical protein [Dehalococcoidia bacterium]
MNARQWIDPWIDPFKRETPRLTEEQMLEDILWYVQTRDWVTPVELRGRYGERGTGDHALTLGTNLIVWTGLSESLVTAILRLLEKREIHAHPVSWLTYLIDGGGLKLPLAKRPPKRGYTREHWAPLAFRMGPRCGLKDCPGNRNS